jgi:hypothetical protein
MKKTANDLAEALCGKGSNIPMIRAAARWAEHLGSALAILLEAPEGVRLDAVKGALDYLPSQDWYPLIATTLDTFNNCLGLGPGAELFYRHDEEGYPYGIGDEPVARGWEISYVASTTAHLGTTRARWLWQNWNSRWANLHRLGGLPSWVQEPGHPACPMCGQTMPFLMQLDSGLLTQDGGYVHWCSGLLYAFWCDRCKVSAFFRHCC